MRGIVQFPGAPADAAFAGGLRLEAGDWAATGTGATDRTMDRTARTDSRTFILLISLPLIVFRLCPKGNGHGKKPDRRNKAMLIWFSGESVAMCLDSVRRSRVACVPVKGDRRV